MKYLFSLVLFVLITVAAHSQFVIFGAKGGLNLATFTGNDVNNAKFLPSFHIGGLANFLINENFMVQPEVLYSGKGSKSSNQGTFKFGYINIPVLLQYKTASGFFVEAGPQVGFLVSSKWNKTDWKDYTKSTDYSWVAGIGYKSAMGIGAGARYDFGYFNVAKEGIIRNKAIMINLFYTFSSGAE